MADKGGQQDIEKTLGKILDSKLKPLHGEIARVTREVRELKFENMGIRGRVVKLDKELARFDSNIETLGEKADALLVDMNEVQDTTKAIWDKISLESDKTKREITEIREHIGLEAA